MKRNLSTKDHGAAAVEFALVAPILFAIIIGIVEFGIAYNYQTQLNNAAMTAARDYSFNRNWSQSQNVVRNMVNLPTAGTTISLTGNCPAIESTTKNTITVSVQTKKPTLTNFFGSTFTINGKGVAECI